MEKRKEKRKTKKNVGTNPIRLNDKVLGSCPERPQCTTSSDHQFQSLGPVIWNSFPLSLYQTFSLHSLLLSQN